MLLYYKESFNYFILFYFIFNLIKVKKKRELYSINIGNRSSSGSRFRCFFGFWLGVDFFSGVLEVLEDFVGDGGLVLERKKG